MNKLAHGSTTFAHDRRPDKRVLDIGCGWGANLEYLAPRGREGRQGITLSQGAAREINAARAARGDRAVRDYVELRAGEKFDALISICMIEHICSPEEARAGKAIEMLPRVLQAVLGAGQARRVVRPPDHPAQPRAARPRRTSRTSAGSPTRSSRAGSTRASRTSSRRSTRTGRSSQVQTRREHYGRRRAMALARPPATNRGDPRASGATSASTTTTATCRPACGPSDALSVLRAVLVTPDRLIVRKGAAHGS